MWNHILDLKLETQVCWCYTAISYFIVYVHVLVKNTLQQHSSSNTA